jgi:HD-GYP domain-containing protein (c-di-GMP phosphodiesterase class II)
MTNLVRKFLLKKRHPYSDMLIQASSGMVLITDVYKLLKLIVYIVKKHVGVKSVSVFLYDEKEGSFVLISHRGENRYLNEARIYKDNPLITWLEENSNVLLRRALKDLNAMVGLKEALERLDCEVCVPSFWKGRLLGFLVLGKKRSKRTYEREEVELLLTLSNGVAVAVENARNFSELKKIREREKENYFQTVLALAQTVDEKDTYTHGHLEEVFFYGMQVFEELEQLPELKESINKEDLKTALRLHDIGKIGIPDVVLHKTEKLSPDEWEIMKQHCEIGARIVEPIEKLRNVGNIIKHHQERYDGTGYPDGLKGEEIPIESRIIAVVDAFHAMISNRPYRKALSVDVALNELSSNIGIQFDPVVVAAFVRLWEKGKIKERIKRNKGLRVW